ncbi:MAG: polymer-forming cytoskeletal protein [Acidobacteriota bacterium]|nr:polymer-forming cytoskeletal protein [Acidobacteriota bacterium]
MTDTFATVIGPGVVIKGSLHSGQDVLLYGEIEGRLDVENHRLTIAPNGKVLANARAREVDIYGSIDGDVDSTLKVLIRTGGRLTGDIRAAGIVIEDGAVFKGAVAIVNVTGQEQSAGEV